MKKFTVLFIVLFLALASSACAETYYLTCASQEGIVKYSFVAINTQTSTVYQVECPAQADGSALCDLTPLPSGKYSLTLSAIDATGWGSDPSESYPAQKPGKSGQIRIITK